MNMKKRFKKGIVFTLILALLTTLWPAGLLNDVFAAPGDRNGNVSDFVNFILDTSVRNSLGTPITDNTLPTQTGQVGATNFYRFGQKSLNVSGSTNGIKTSDPVYVKVEQLIKDGSTWRVAANLGNTPLIIDTANTRKFSGTISLQDGMNRLTFTGKASDGITTITEVTYVRYDSTIFLNSMNLLDGNTVVPMDGIVPSASKTNTVMVEIKATNATRVKLNNREYTPYGNDTFLVGPLNLTQGLNTFNFVIENREGTQQTYTREVYFYDPNTLFVDGNFTINTMTRNAFTTTPAFPVDLTTNINGSLVGKILVPYTGNATSQAAQLQSTSFANSSFSTSTIGGGTITGLTVNGSNVQLVRGPSGFDYAVYTATFTFTKNAPSSANDIYTLAMNSTYISTQSPSTRSFSFRVQDASQTYVTNVFYRPSASGATEVTLSSTQATKIASADYASTSFRVEATTPVAGASYTIRSPYNTYNGTLDGAGQLSLANLPSGEYVLSVSVSGSEFYDVRILIDNTPVIALKEYAEGITLDHTYLGNPRNIEIELVNIITGDNINGTSLFINGNQHFEITGGSISPASNGTIQTYSDKTLITAQGVNWRRGENTIEINLFKDGRQATKRTVTFFIEDSRTPKVSEFKPVLIPRAPATRAPLISPDAWKDSDDISYSKDTGNHVTIDENFDLIIQAFQTKQIELVMNGETVLTYSYDIGTGVVTIPTMISIEGQNRLVGYDEPLVNGERRTTIRIQDLDFVKSNIHTFVLKIVNVNGSMATIPMEFRKDVVPYLVKSPVPTVGKDIIVNRNYVPLYIKAEGANKITIGKENAVYNKDNKWFEHTYIGLKENKWNKIKFTVFRGTDKIDGEVNVYYANTNQPGAGNLVAMGKKVKVLNNLVSLDFPKGTVLRNRELVNNRKPLYEGHNLLIGLADRENGLIESRNYDGSPAFVHSGLRSRYASLPNTFVEASPIVYINGGLGEQVIGTTTYAPIKNGIQPHDAEYTFTDPLIKDRMLEPSQRGNLTLEFDPSIRNQASTIVTVFRLNQDGRWQNIGGVVSGNKITVPFDDFGYYVVMKWRGSFEDVSNHPWARNAMEVLYAKGFMNGKQQGVEFGTVDPVTRGEFAQLLVKALGIRLNADGSPTFLDVGIGFTGRGGSMPHEEAVWEHKYIETAARAGIVRGYSGNLFLPNRSLTREEAALMIASALNLKMAKNDTKLKQELLKMYQDGNKASFYSRPALIAVNKAKIMEGGLAGTVREGEKPKYNFYPSDTLTRAEAAVMIARLLKNQLKKLPKDFDTTNPNGQL